MRSLLKASVALAAAGAGVANAQAQAPAAPPAPVPYFVGNPVGLPTNPAPDGAFNPISENVKVFGALYSTESCSYDPDLDLIVAPNRGVNQATQANNAFISLINHDGSVHTARWIGVQNPAQRANLDPPLVLNEPFGSDIVGGVLYLADRDGGTPDPNNPGQNVPGVSVIRMFNMADGTPAGEIRVEGSTGFNDLEVADDGTIYASNSGQGGNNPDTSTWQIWKITPDGQATMWIQGPPLNRPNGVAIDNDGNVVVVNQGDDAVLTFSAADASLLTTEKALQVGLDGIVIMEDGTKYVSSVMNGGIMRIPAGGGPAELIAENVPSAASMCYDPTANQLVVPLNANNGLAFVPLD